MFQAKAAAVDAIRGHTWRKQFFEETRTDPATGKIQNLPTLCLTYQAEYQLWEIIVYWDKLTVVAPTAK